MKKTAAATTTNITSEPQPAVVKLHIGSTFLDTTWRIAVPVLICVGLGIFADTRLGSKPWLTLLGVVLGFVGAGWLVKRQIVASETEDTR